MTGRLLEILLVEDNEDDRLLIEEAFGEARQAKLINTVRDGEEALSYLRQEGKYRVARTPSIVVLDINMPKKNGFEVLAAMKRDPKLQSLPVIMLTTSGREEDIIRSYENGACSYICKPVTFAQLTEAIDQFERYWTAVSSIPQRQE